MCVQHISCPVCCRWGRSADLCSVFLSSRTQLLHVPLWNTAVHVRLFPGWLDQTEGKALLTTFPQFHLNALMKLVSIICVPRAGLEVLQTWSRSLGFIFNTNWTILRLFQNLEGSLLPDCFYVWAHCWDVSRTNCSCRPSSRVFILKFQTQPRVSRRPAGVQVITQRNSSFSNGGFLILETDSLQIVSHFPACLTASTASFW